MRCTKCGFISFDHYTACTRCKADLAELHRTLQGSSIKVDLPLFLAPALQESLHEGYNAVEEAQEIAVAEAPEQEPVGLEAVAAELESQAMIDDIMTSAASQATLEEEVPSIDLGQFEAGQPQEEARAELPELDLGLALETEGAAVAEEPEAGGAAELAEVPAPEFSELVVEEPGGEEVAELETLKGAEAPEIEFTLPEEPAAENGEFVLQEAEAPSDIDDLSLGLEEINLADLVPGAASSEESAAEDQGGIDFDLGLSDFKAGASAPEEKEGGGNDIFDLASIMDEPGDKPSPEASSEIVDLDDFYGAPETTAETAPETGSVEKTGGGIPFKLEMEETKEEPPATPEETPPGAVMDDQEFLPDLDLKLEEDK